jgi:hypothetical protein
MTMNHDSFQERHREIHGVKKENRERESRKRLRSRKSTNAEDRQTKRMAVQPKVWWLVTHASHLPRVTKWSKTGRNTSVSSNQMHQLTSAM